MDFRRKGFEGKCRDVLLVETAGRFLDNVPENHCIMTNKSCLVYFQRNFNLK